MLKRFSLLFNLLLIVEKKRKRKIRLDLYERIYYPLILTEFKNIIN
jgi:hypothetical protein